MDNNNIAQLKTLVVRLLNIIKKENLYFDHPKYTKKCKLLSKLCKEYLRAKRKNKDILLNDVKLKITKQANQLNIDDKMTSNIFNSNEPKPLIDKLITSLSHKKLTTEEQLEFFIERGNTYFNIVKNFSINGGTEYYDHIINYKITNMNKYNDTLKYLKDLIANNKNLIIIESKEDHFDDKGHYFISFLTDSYTGSFINEHLFKNKNHIKARSATMLPSMDNLITKNEVFNYDKEDFRIYSSINKYNLFLKNHYSIVCKQSNFNPLIGFASISTTGTPTKFPHKILKQLMTLKKI